MCAPFSMSRPLLCLPAGVTHTPCPPPLPCRCRCSYQLGKETQTTPPLVGADPRWSWGHKFTLYDVDVEKTPEIEVDVQEQGLGLSTIGLGDASLGSAVIPFRDVLRSCQVRVRA